MFTYKGLNKFNIFESVKKVDKGGGSIFVLVMGMADKWLCTKYLVSACAGRVDNRF